MKSRNREPLICLLFPERSPNGVPDVTHVKIQTDPSECDGLSEQGSPSSVPIGIKNVWGKKKSVWEGKWGPWLKHAVCSWSFQWKDLDIGVILSQRVQICIRALSLEKLLQIVWRASRRQSTVRCQVAKWVLGQEEKGPRGDIPLNIPIWVSPLPGYFNAIPGDANVILPYGVLVQ